MEKKQNANKLISSLVALSLATTLGVPTIALAEGTDDNVGGGASSGIVTPAPQGEGEGGSSADSGTSEAIATELPTPDSEGVIKLVNNVTLAKVYEVNKKITIDLNGHNIGTSLTGKQGRIFSVVDGGDLTIKGEGIINAPYSSIDINGDCTPNHSSSVSAKATIESGTLTANEGAIGVYGNGAELTVNGGTIIGRDNGAIMGNGTKNEKADYGGYKITITGGTITGNTTSEGYRNCGIYHPNSGDLTITGGTITGTTGAGVVVRSGNLNVTGGTISGKGEGGDNLKMGDAVPTYCGGIEIGYSVKYPGGMGNISVTGGTISSEKSDAFKVIGTKTSGSSIAITGGTFSDPNVYQYAQSGTVNVALAKDYTGNVTIPAGVASTLDLNGKTIQHSGTAVLNNGTLTVKATNGGTIKSTENAGIGVGNNSKTIIDSGTIEGVEGAVITGYAVNADITINDGQYSASDNAVIAGNGNLTNRNVEGNPSRDGFNTITINGGTFTGGIKTQGYVACGIYSPWKDVINVNGGTFNITNGAGIVARAGNVTISGGTFNTTGNATGKVGDSRVVVPCSTLVFDAAAGYPAMSGQSVIFVKGGTFSSENTGSICVLPADGSAAKRVVLAGGTFSSDPTNFLANGYSYCKDSDGNFVVYYPIPAPAPTTETTTTTNPDGTTTTTVTDKKTGESTATTEGDNGTTVVEKTDASGATTTEITVPADTAAAAEGPVEVPAAIEVAENQAVSVSAPAGTVVAIPVSDENAGNVAVIVHADGTEEPIPMSLVEDGKIVVKVDGNETIKVVNNAKDFEDVADEHWAADDIGFASSHAIFLGIANGSTYEPETALTRNMMMTVLARVDGADTEDSDPWYAKGQAWAVENEVSNGLRGEDNITREQLVTMLFNYANKAGLDTSARADLASYPDASGVSEWASEAVSWAVAEGILKGVNNTDIDPQGWATRAQAAAFMQRYVHAALL